MTSVIVSNIPPECTRDDLLEAFPKNVNYLLFPLGTDFSKCVIEFKDASGMSEMQSSSNVQLFMYPFTMQIFSSCVSRIDVLMCPQTKN